MRKPPFVVTGAHGFIGRYVVSRLLADGNVVYAVSRTQGLSIPGVRNHTVSSYVDTPQISGAICIHLAGMNALPAGEVDHAQYTVDAMRVGEALLSKGFSKLVFVSSALVYGFDHSYRRREDELISPANAYGQLKFDVESMFSSSNHAVARLSNVYGIGMSPINVFSDILAQVSGSGPILMRNTTSVRDYLEVSDAANGLVHLALSSVSGIFNFGTGVGTSVSDLINYILDLHGVPPRLVKSTEEGIPSHLVLDPSKAYELLGWRSKVSLVDGLKVFVEPNHA